MPRNMVTNSFNHTTGIMNATLAHNPPMDNATLAMFQNTTLGIVISGIYMFVTLVSVVSNGTALWLLVFRTSPKTPTVFFMINLTLADLLVSSVLPFQIYYIWSNYNWTLGEASCTVLTVVFYANMYCSILTMTAISVDRYLGIVKPLLFRDLRKKSYYAVFLCALMWAVVLGILYPLETANLLYEVHELSIVTCFDVIRLDILPTLYHWAALFSTMFLFLFLLPLIITIYCYIRIIYTLAKDKQSQQKAKVIRLAIIVLFVFIVCFAPNNILMIVHAVNRLFYEKSFYVAYKLSLSLSCVNSCLDPFIFYFASKDFRRKLRHMLNVQTLSSAEVHAALKEDLYSMRSQPEDDVLSTCYTGETVILRADSVMSRPSVIYK